MIHATTTHRKGLDKTRPAWTNNLGVSCLHVMGVRETFASKVPFFNQTERCVVSARVFSVNSRQLQNGFATRLVTPTNVDLPKIMVHQGAKLEFWIGLSTNSFSTPAGTGIPEDISTPTTVNPFVKNKKLAWKGCWLQKLWSHWS